MKDGTKSNRRGNRLEDQIKHLLDSYKLQYKCQEPIAKSMYGHTLKVDLIAYGVMDYENGLIIEVKWQQASGSADEKYPYLVGNIKGDYGGARGYPFPTVIVYGGPGAREYANQWMRRQKSGKLIGVYTFDEFMCWLNQKEGHQSEIEQLRFG